jgi:hypothetical protein
MPVRPPSLAALSRCSSPSKVNIKVKVKEVVGLAAST